MAYPEPLIAAMRQDLTQYGITETRTPQEVDQVLSSHESVLMVVNSVCGCAAGKARPAVGLALKHSPVKPAAVATVFAGGDVEATQHLREKHLPGVPASSPSMALFRNGQPVWVMHRFQIESSIAPEIAKQIISAFEQHCAPALA
jgi:putative YphP/YqiW family bacilliredoxin